MYQFFIAKKAKNINKGGQQQCVQLRLCAMPAGQCLSAKALRPRGDMDEIMQAGPEAMEEFADEF